MTITISYGSPDALSGYTWRERTPWIAEPRVQYVATFSGGSMYDHGKALPTCTVRGFALRNSANEAALSTIASQAVTVSDPAGTYTARVTGISDAGSTAAYLHVTLTLRRTA
ncbi:MAG: hypothetical protein J5494_01600 [Candidatus Methanomethylophilaceae archaeon]|nr:hypothetical protein [Candidatus Methanomethylophilaceae archaeon]